jgi:hypothetical protein
VQKPALGFSFHHTQNVDNIDPAADFAAVMRLTQLEALIGRLDEGVALKLAFFTSSSQTASWSDEPSHLKSS